MYVREVRLTNLRCFKKAHISLSYPGTSTEPKRLPNVTVLLGDNGTGKTTILKAIAIAALAPVLRDVGFVPRFLVRRAKRKVVGASVRASLSFDEIDGKDVPSRARFEVQFVGTREVSDRIAKTSCPPGFGWANAYHRRQPKAFLTLAYGSGRRMARTETGETDKFPLRNRRVAALFDEHVPLAPISRWLPHQNAGRRTQVANVLDELLVDHQLKVDRERMTEEGGPYFVQYTSELPLEALSDGFRGFVSWVSDLLMHLTEAVPSGKKLRDVTGVVLIDEVDLLLHPAWQRTVVPGLSRAFPKLQFIVSTHSPLVASSVWAENLRVMARAEDGTVTVTLPEDETWGRTSEQLLTSPLFGLQTTRPADASDLMTELADKAGKGRSPAAVERLLAALSTGPGEAAQSSPRPRRAAKRRKGAVRVAK